MYVRNNPVTLVDPFGLLEANIKNLQNSFQDSLVDAVSVGLIIGDIILGGPTGEGIGPAVALQCAKAARHAKLIKEIVRSASKEGVKLNASEIKQLENVVIKAGGRLRTEIGLKGSVKGIKHSHVEGFGSKTAGRHIIHLTE